MFHREAPGIAQLYASRAARIAFVWYMHCCPNDAHANRPAYPMERILRGWKGCIGTMSKTLKMKV
jgi:hypothetical protein